MFLVGLVVLFVLNMYSVILKKYENIMGFISMVYIAIVVGFAPKVVPDYDNYQWSYIHRGGGYEMGYNFLGHVANSLQLSYQQFRFLLVLGGYLLIYFGIRKFTKHIPIFAIYYLLFPFAVDVAQIRNFMVMSIITFAASFLIDLNRRNIITFIVLVFIASTFHVLGFVYILILPIRMIKKETIQKILMWLTPLYLLFVVIRPVRVLLSSLISASGLGSIGKISHVLNYLNSSTNYGFVIPIGFTALAYLFSQYSFYVNENADYEIEGDRSAWLSKLEVMNSYIALGVFFFPLYALNFDFFRLMRNTYPMIIAQGIFVIYASKTKKQKITISIIFTIFMILSYLLMEYNLSFEKEFIPLFS